MKTIIFDLDGTLCNIDHRLYLIRQDVPDWDSFNKCCVYDTVVQPLAQLVRYLNKEYHIVMCTGRMQNVEDQTRLWLETNNLPSSLLLMREVGDLRSDVEVKLEQLNYIQDEMGHNVMMVFDDRDSVVQMYRDQGIQCCQVKKGDY